MRNLAEQRCSPSSFSVFAPVYLEDGPDLQMVLQVLAYTRQAFVDDVGMPKPVAKRSLLADAG